MTARTRIKVCGMTKRADVSAAVEAGVDAIGFIFVDKSPRNVDPAKVKDIVSSLPPFVDAVGVFMNAPMEFVKEIVQYCSLTTVQLHGMETPEYCREVSCRVIKTFSIRPADADSETGPYYGPYFSIASGYLLDTYHETLGGGTGQTFDWSIIDRIMPPGPVILAGGLNPDNIEAAIKTVRPFAIDVNSGVESAPGEKDLEKLAQLIENVKKADAEQN